MYLCGCCYNDFSLSLLLLCREGREGIRRSTAERRGGYILARRLAKAIRKQRTNPVHKESLYSPLWDINKLNRIIIINILLPGLGEPSQNH